MDLRSLTETDIRTKIITPAIVGAGWDIQKQIREEVYFTDGRIRVLGAIVEAKTAEYLTNAK